MSYMEKLVYTHTYFFYTKGKFMTTVAKRNIFLRIFSGFWSFLDRGWHALLNVLFLFFLIWAISAFFSGKEVKIPKGAALIINPAGFIVEQKDYVDPISQIINDATNSSKPPQTALIDILDAIRNGAKDKRISALVIDTNTMEGAGLTKLQAIGEAIDTFKNSGKPVIAKGTFFGQSQYLLAAHADEIYLDPEGGVIMEGFGRFKTYYKSLFDNLDIDIHVFKVGKFKSAVEPFLLDQMSDPAKEANLRWLGVLWDAYKQDISSARNISVDDIDSYVNGYPELIKKASGDNAAIALENKFVDGLKDSIQFRAYMVDKVGEDKKGETYKHVSMNKYLKTIRQPFEIYDDSTDKIALITAKGAIMDGNQVEGSIGGTSLAKLIRKARNDDSIKAVVLRVDSPGGSAFASEVIRREIVATKAAGKKFVVSMGTYAASGGYWISADADEIWARPTTITGSIGIFGMFPTIDRPLAKMGIHRDGIGTTPLAGAISIASPLSPEYAELIQEMINHGYDNFLKIVANGRNMTTEEVDEIAQGRVWAGSDALKLGLVDKLGTLQDALDSAAAMVDLGEDYEVYHIKRELTDEEKMMQQFFASTDIELPKSTQNKMDIVSKITGFAISELDKLSIFNDPKGIYLNCMCSLEN